MNHAKTLLHGMLVMLILPYLPFLPLPCLFSVNKHFNNSISLYFLCLLMSFKPSAIWMLSKLFAKFSEFFLNAKLVIVVFRYIHIE